MEDSPHALLALQALDTELDQLRHRRATLAERARLREVATGLAATEAEGAEVTLQRDGLVGRQTQLEAELADIQKRSTELDGRMRSGTVTAPRDLQAMVDQIAALKRRQGDLEDSDLEVMEALEPLEARLVELQDKWAALDAERTQLGASLAAAEVAVDAELSVATASRAEAVTIVPAELLATYERLRERLGGIGVAPLVGSSCGGCHLTMSASELDRIRRQPADAVVTCEQCGRILVR